MTVIDVHTHIVPSHIPLGPSAETKWPSVEVSSDDDARVMIAGQVFRKIDSRSWDVARRQKDMAGDGVDRQVLSPMPELLSHWLSPDAGEALATVMNDEIARMVGASNGAFAGIGMVCMQDASRALREIARLKKLGLRGIEIGTHINGVPLGAKELWPVYEAAEALDLVLFVHPLHPAGLERIGATPEYAAVAAFPLETALAAVSLLANGVIERFPRLRILLSHGGGALPWILPRLDRGYELSAAMRSAMSERPSQLAKRLWYDTILYSDQSLEFLASAVGQGHIVVGSDYPFAIMQERPGIAAAQALGAGASCLSTNAEMLFGMATR
ncbi:MAG: amidohydrolase family protein [Bradyrhizobium sp.]